MKQCNKETQKQRNTETKNKENKETNKIKKGQKETEKTYTNFKIRTRV